MLIAIRLREYIVTIALFSLSTIHMVVNLTLSYFVTSIQSRLSGCWKLEIVKNSFSLRATHNESIICKYKICATYMYIIIIASYDDYDYDL